MSKPLSNVPFDAPLLVKGQLAKRWADWFLEVKNLLALLPPIFQGTGDPNGQITASPPALYFDPGGGPGAEGWIKQSGQGTNTGWVNYV